MYQNLKLMREQLEDINQESSEIDEKIKRNCQQLFERRDLLKTTASTLKAQIKEEEQLLNSYAVSRFIQTGQKDFPFGIIKQMSVYEIERGKVINYLADNGLRGMLTFNDKDITKLSERQSIPGIVQKKEPKLFINSKLE